MAIVAASALALTSYVIVSRSRKGAPGGAATAAVPITAYPGSPVNPSISPDGNKVAFAWGLGGRGSNRDIYVKSMRSGEPQRLTTNPARDDAPAWSPDGRSIAFMRSIPGRIPWHYRDLMVVPAAGGDERRVTTMSVLDARKRSSRGLAWSPDGRWIAVGGQPSDERLPRHLADCGRRRRAALAHERTQRRSRRTAGILAGWKPSGLPPSITAHRRSSVHVLSLSPELTASGPPTRVASEDSAIGGLAWTPDGRDLVFSSARGPSVARFSKGFRSVEGPTSRSVSQSAWLLDKGRWM